MSRYDHPLTAEPREEINKDETVTFEDVTVRVRISPDGKRATLTVIDGDDSEKFELGGATLNSVPFQVDRAVKLYGVDAVIEWQAGGLGLYPGVDVRVTRGGDN